MTIILLGRRSVVILKKYFSTFFALFCFLALLCIIGAEAENRSVSAAVYSDILRLHIVANSDSTQDQSIKYKVRDGLLPTVQSLFSECKTVDEALFKANGNKTRLENEARRILAENCCDQKVHVEVGRAHYPQKTYGGIVYPEGEYLSVRILLGEGDGQNWWCVLFPSLCDIGIEQESVAAASGGQVHKDDGGIELFGCRIKLKILEFFE